MKIRSKKKAAKIDVHVNPKPHRCGVFRSGTVSCSTILKIILNKRSFPEVIFPRFCVIGTREEGAQKRTESGGQAPILSERLGCRAHRCAKNTCGLQWYFLRPTPQPARRSSTQSLFLSFLIYHQPNREAECKVQFPPLTLLVLLHAIVVLAHQERTTE